MRHLARHDRRTASFATVARPHPISRPAPEAVETAPFATGGPAGPGIPWSPETESPVDTDNAPEIAFADGLAPSGAPLVPPPRVRWRQRTPGRNRAAVDAAPAEAGDRGDHVGEPLQSPGPGHVANAADIPHATESLHPTGVAGTVGSPRGHRDLAADDDAGTDIDGTVDAMLDPQAEPHPVLDPDDAAGASRTDPQRAPREIELWLLARRAQGATLSLDFELRTAMARQVFRRDFVYVSRQLHALEGSRRVQGLDRARLNDALATLRQRADAIQAFMAQRAAELQAAIAARGPAGAHIAFARPARFQATIVSPGAHRFLGLLMQADETLAILEMAWLLGLVEPATRAALVSDCRRALLGFKDLACDLRHAVGLLVQEINAQRREGHAAAPED